MCIRDRSNTHSGDPVDDGAAAATVHARSLLHLQHRDFRDRHVGCDQSDETARLVGLPDSAVDNNALALVLERGFNTYRAA